MRYEFRYLDPPSDLDQDPDPDQEFWLSIWWGNRGADFWISFFRKIHIRGVLTFWPWCYFLTLVSRLPAIFGRSYPSGCIGHRPLVSSALRSYGDRCRPRVPSNPAACFPPFISIWLYFWAFFVLGLWNTQFAYSAFIHSAATILADLKS